MAIKVIAQRREVKLGKNPGMKFVMRFGVRSKAVADLEDVRVCRFDTPSLLFSYRNN